ncbi:MAG TPA: HAD-IA family hydrolase [Verrucomicrobiae bacterium]|nr:HAD-IA family hydrolase [Verrucomicrobiae bacterium]
MPRRFDLLIFDWDGTLADSAAQIVSSFQHAIASLKLPSRTDAQIRNLIGLGFLDAMGRLFPEFAPEDVVKALEDYRRLLVGGGQMIHGPAEAPLFDGALDALRALQGDGYRIAVATGKSRASLKRSLLKHPEVQALIRISRCADETLPKPDPLMLREILDEEGVPPARALMIGDTEYDMAMARAVGMPGLGVSCGVHEGERLSAAGAEVLLAHVHELPGWLGR